MHLPASIDDDWARAVSIGVTRGSPAALESLYRARSAQLYRLIRSRTKRDDAFVLDCVHDAWIRVVRHVPQCPTLDALDRWLTRAALSAAIDRLRTDAARDRREGSSISLPPAPATESEYVRALVAELAHLTDDERDLLRLRYRSGLSLEAMARTLGIGAKAVEMRVRRALARLRQRMEREHDEAAHD